jgi:hypothetical protein
MLHSGADGAAAYYCGLAILETELVKGVMATVGKFSSVRHHYK